MNYENNNNGIVKDIPIPDIPDRTPNDSQQSFQNIVNDLYSKIDLLSKQKQDMSSNLSQQGRLINETSKINKELEDEVKRLREENKQLKEVSTQPKDNNFPNGDVLDRLNVLENSYKEEQKMRYQKQLEDMLISMKNVGVRQEDLENTLEIIKKTYGVDLIKNPNNNAASALSQLILQSQSVSSTIPVGGNTPLQPQSIDDDTAYQKLLEARTKNLYDKYNKK